MFDITRRAFLKGLFATATVSALGADFKKRKPNLVFGAVSDVHIAETRDGLIKSGNTAVWENALRWYDAKGIDALVVAGDIADNGLVSQFKNFADAWFKIFPNDKAADGRHVERVFVHGNHDVEGFKYISRGNKPKEEMLFNQSIIKNCSAAWDFCFHEEFKPVFAKEVKGYSFLCAHWGQFAAVPQFIEETASKINPATPFFYVQHPHPKDTVYGPWAWGHDNGFSTNALSKFHNAIAFSGHSHYPLSDEAGIWQDSFTAIGTSSLRYIGKRYGRDNSSTFLGDYSFTPSSANNDQQGLLISVYDDVIVVERHDFTHDESIAEDWVLPLPLCQEKPYNHATRKAQFAKNPPKFAENAAAEITVTEGTGKPRVNRNLKIKAPESKRQVLVTFPPATASGTPAFDYEITIEHNEYDATTIYDSKRVFDPQFFHASSHTPKAIECAFAAIEIPLQTSIRFAITPMDYFGNRGVTIYSKYLKLTGK